MKLFIGSDHGGFNHKDQLIHSLENEYEIKDLGNNILDPNDDYVDYAKNVAESVSKDLDSRGILICRSGFGMCITANKYKGVRAVCVKNIEDAIKSREHNDANIICLDGDNTNFKEILNITMSFLKTNFSNEERHKRRIEKINSIENLNFIA